MKQYLLLENGLQLACSIPVDENLVGCVMKKDGGQWELTCGELGSFSIDASHYALLSFEKMMGKYIVDQLPVEYHLHDLKTMIPMVN